MNEVSRRRKPGELIVERIRTLYALDKQFYFEYSRIVVISVHVVAILFMNAKVAKVIL